MRVPNPRVVGADFQAMAEEIAMTDRTNTRERRGAGSHRSSLTSLDASFAHAAPTHRRRSAARAVLRQGSLFERGWGGARRGAGRKPQGARPGVPHRPRAALAARHPVHVTVRVRTGLPSLRGAQVRPVIFTALAAGAERFGFRLVHFSVQTNHLHLLAEARDRRALARGVKGLLVRLARALNRC